MLFSNPRAFLKSKWGMEEFIIAHNEAVDNRRRNFMIIILREKLDMAGLRKDLKLYLQTNTYIDATKSTKQTAERLRYFPCGFVVWHDMV